MNNKFLLLGLTGIILIFIHFYIVPPDPEIEYRYLPRNLDQNMKDAAFSSELLKPMFNESGPWINVAQTI